MANPSVMLNVGRRTEAGTVRETMLYCMTEDPPTGQPTFTGLDNMMVSANLDGKKPYR